MSETLLLIVTYGEAKWLSLFLYSSPAAFHVCRTKSDRVGLEVQATWFGELRKNPFFKTSDLGDSPSYAMGDALWQLERTSSRSTS